MTEFGFVKGVGAFLLIVGVGMSVNGTVRGYDSDLQVGALLTVIGLWILL